MNRLITILSGLPLRVTALLGAILLGVVVWLSTKLFPSADRHTIASIGAFTIAAIFAISVGRRRA